MEQLVKLYRETHLAGRLPAYDGRKSLYTAGALPFSSKEFKITLVDEEDGPGGARYFFLAVFSTHILIFSSVHFIGITYFVLNISFSLYCRREREFTVVIKFAARADLHHLGMFLQGRQADAPQEALQVLDIVLRELPTSRYVLSPAVFSLLGLYPSFVLIILYFRYCPVGRSFYSPDLGRRQPLGEGLESWRGFYQSIRPTQMGLSLNIGEPLFLGLV